MISPSPLEVYIQKMRLYEAGQYISIIDLYKSSEQIGPSVTALRDEFRSLSRNHVPAFIDSFSAQISHLKSIESNLSQVHHSIDSLGAALENGLDAIAWRLDASNRHLDRIAFALENPNRTRAQEYKATGDRALGHGWIDDAEREFLSVVSIYPYDFDAQTKLGLISLDHRGNLDSARKYFAEANKFAAPNDPFTAAFACVKIAGIYLIQNDLSSAVKFLDEALLHYPQMSSALFLKAEACALDGKIAEGLHFLQLAVNIDPLFAHKVYVSQPWLPHRSELDEFFHQQLSRINNSEKRITKIIEEFPLGNTDCNFSLDSLSYRLTYGVEIISDAGNLYHILHEQTNYNYSYKDVQSTNYIDGRSGIDNFIWRTTDRWKLLQDQLAKMRQEADVLFSDISKRQENPSETSYAVEPSICGGVSAAVVAIMVLIVRIYLVFSEAKSDADIFFGMLGVLIFGVIWAAIGGAVAYFSGWSLSIIIMKAISLQKKMNTDGQLNHLRRQLEQNMHSVEISTSNMKRFYDALMREVESLPWSKNLTQKG